MAAILKGVLLYHQDHNEHIPALIGQQFYINNVNHFFFIHPYIENLSEFLKFTCKDAISGM